MPLDQENVVLKLGNTRSEETCRSHCKRGEITMWTKPEFTEMRFGFEVTMYIYNR